VFSILNFAVQQAFEISQLLIFSFMLANVEELEELLQKQSRTPIKLVTKTLTLTSPSPSIRELAKT
jgi:hypothetical protein